MVVQFFQIAPFKTAQFTDSWHNFASSDELHIVDIFHESLQLIEGGCLVLLHSDADAINVIAHFAAHVAVEQAPQMLNEWVREELLPLAFIVVKKDIKVALPKNVSLSAK